MVVPCLLAVVRGGSVDFGVVVRVMTVSVVVELVVVERVVVVGAVTVVVALVALVVGRVVAPAVVCTAGFVEHALHREHDSGQKVWTALLEQAADGGSECLGQLSWSPVLQQGTSWVAPRRVATATATATNSRCAKLTML